ncbi:hypothetical protein [Fodinibius sp. AD559]|uniref:hypothetical protein n=1 Tax=Fodinibius sp. AD559 TaxID=3424179 RepID=UPI004046F378
MKNQRAVTFLSSVIVLLAIVAASMGIFSSGGPGAYEIETVRGETVTVYGEGVYKHMSADVAPQGIAQDYVTLFVGVPLLIISLVWARKNSLKGRFMLAGVLGYFLVTYLFYLVMAMYNILFLVYVALLGSSFFALALTFFSFDLQKLPEFFSESVPRTFTSGFLIFNSIIIALLWLGVVVPPLLDGKIIPSQVEHYTTLIVQGLDLALLLPLSLLSGWLFLKQKPMGYVMAPVYVVFLSILMMALTAKIIAMGLLGQSVIPAIIIIPLFALTAIFCSVSIIRNIQEPYWINS